MVHILNTGGTFNKVYDAIKGTLVVPKNDEAVEDIVKHIRIATSIEGIIYKDSLDMDDRDREVLAQRVAQSKSKRVVIVHGTDTMDLSAAYLAQKRLDKIVVFTGAMIPYSIEKTEAAANLSLALYSASTHSKSGVYVAIQGLFAPYERIYKDRERGLFCLR